MSLRLKECEQEKKSSQLYNKLKQFLPSDFQNGCTDKQNGSLDLLKYLIKLLQLSKIKFWSFGQNSFNHCLFTENTETEKKAFSFSLASLQMYLEILLCYKEN